MSSDPRKGVKDICSRVANDRTRLMDVVRDVQATYGCVNDDAIDLIAEHLSMHRVEVEGVVTFYAFLGEEKKGDVVIRVCDDVIDEFKGSDQVVRAFCRELKIKIGETTPDGRISLDSTPCIGMSDQAPAALINDTVITSLDACRAREIVQALKKGSAPESLVTTLGDGNNSDALIGAMVNNNIRCRGEVIFAPFADGVAIEKSLAMRPAEVIRDIKTSRLRGRGGAGFPTGMKWDFTRQADGERKFVLCNGDEGEPGTFKDRVILTECPGLMFEGMTVAGYAIGAETGILYLRGEYAYLRKWLESELEKRRSQGLLGPSVCGKDGFNFDIRIQMGAGAYVCGEETSLISSCEGQRGDPKTRPPFPAQRGYLGYPTTVNNVETFCCAARILDKGAGWFAKLGSDESPGTKLLSVSGDCRTPGVFEVPFGISVREVLGLVGASNAIAVQIGGPAGEMVGPDGFDRAIGYEDLGTGGSVMVFGPGRDMLRIASRFMDFFIDESCGYCTPCRVGNVLIRERLDIIRDGRGAPEDLDYLQELCETVKVCSRCGLGQTSPNPVLTTLKNFRNQYESRVHAAAPGLRSSFDIRAALAAGEDIAGRPSEHF
ncbi:MAG: NAD(P)H-dependent oxidoreductase subunit E [Candidatus Pacebacteria bacterium]|nr:NAD(P)H-dependent oxidoreductase subunit E [Candidatus Paceibacterota bacterium]